MKREIRGDGYINVLNKYGTARDNATAYAYLGEATTPDMQLTQQYETGGLFAKIIDIPAEEAVKHGFDMNLSNPDVDNYIDECLDWLEWEEKAATAIKWARLYGGSLIVMLVNDGRGIDEPLDWQNIQTIEELRVYERPIVQPDYASLYNYDPRDPVKKTTSRFAMPEFYDVFSMYGSFKVHESRCLIFRNGILPEQTTQANYRYWGMPEYVRIRKELREAITSHSYGVKMLERSVQAIYSMKGLAQLLATDDGENSVLKRLEVIDMARGILNSIAIDSEGESYEFKNMQLAGVKDVIDTTCNMLSAVTNIPQTLLFGRSPAGENATGDSDLENYYNHVERIQKLMLRRNLKTLLDVILRAGLANGKIKEEPDYKLEFVPLWSMSESEQATVEQTKAQTSQIKAQTAQIYVDMQVVDPTEVRRGLAKDEDFIIEEILDDSDIDEEWGLGGEPAIPPGQEPQEMEPEPVARAPEKTPPEVSLDAQCETTEQDGGPGSGHQQDEAPPGSAAVLVVRDGKILIGKRREGSGWCGPGGHIEDGETPEQTATRELAEEFGITAKELIEIGTLTGLDQQYGKPVIFLCTEYDGEPIADGKEMADAKFVSIDDLDDLRLFPPFYHSVLLLLDEVAQVNPSMPPADQISDGGPGSGNFGHEGRPGQVGGSQPNGGATVKASQKLSKPSATVLKNRVKKVIQGAEKGDIFELHDSRSEKGKDFAVQKQKDGGWVGKFLDGDGGVLDEIQFFDDEQLIDYVKITSGNPTYVDKEKWHDVEITRRTMNDQELEEHQKTHYRQKGLKEAHQAKISPHIKNLPEAERKVWEKKIQEIEYDFSDDYGKTCYGADGVVHILDGGDDTETIIHETAHAIDDKCFEKTITINPGTDWEYEFKYDSASMHVQVSMTEDMERSDFGSFCKAAGIPTNDEGTWFAEDREYFTEFDEFFSPKAAAMSNIGKYAASDIFSAVTLNRIRSEYLYGGHSTEYWSQGTSGKRPSSIYGESWADFCTIKAVRDQAAETVLAETLPNLHRTLDKTYKEVFAPGVAEQDDSGYNQDAPDENWITMNGTHILIGEKGIITGGPPNLKGKQHKPKSGSKSASKKQTVPKPEVTKKDKKKLGEKKERNQEDSETIKQTPKCRENDARAKAKYGATQMTAEEFVEKALEAGREFSEEDYLLNTAYTGDVPNSLKVNAQAINMKIREGIELNDNEKAVVQHFTDCAKPLGKDTDLYRVVGEDYLYTLLGEKVELPDASQTWRDILPELASGELVSKISNFEGATVVNDALQSTCVGVADWYARNQGRRVFMKIKAPGDVPVCMTTDVSEGEIVLPAGAKTRITRAVYLNNKEGVFAPRWVGGRAARHSPWEVMGLQHYDYGFHNGVYIEMELIGYEQ